MRPQGALAWLVLVALVALAALAGGCSRGPGASATGGPTATSTPSPDGGPPPLDARTSCTVKFVAGGGSGPSAGGPTFTLSNTGTRAFRYCQIEAYAYDKSGKQIAHKGLSYNQTMRPGASTKDTFFPFEETAKTPGLTFEAVVPAVIFLDDSGWRDWSLAPPARPRSGR